jgi:hypothetical protein
MLLLYSHLIILSTVFWINYGGFIQNINYERFGEPDQR